MNRFEFGLLVASLRNDLHWTQQILAERSGVSLPVIRNLERGGRKQLTDDILVSLADGLHLTSMERMEFMFAASGVPEMDLPRKPGEDPAEKFDPGSFLKRSGEQIARIPLPVFVTDAFCDIVLVNHLLIEYYGLPAELLKNADSVIGGFNQMRYVFDPQSNFAQVFSIDNFERQAMLNIHYFRRRTMRMRSKPYFTKLLDELLKTEKYPAFERCWRKILFEELDDFATPFHKVYPDYDFSFMLVESLFALTPCGELYMHQILPATRQTAELLRDIFKRTGAGYELFAPFPDKRKL